MQNEINDLLLNHNSAGSVARQVYERRKADRRSFSLQYLCDRSKIPSKGYLGDFMKGRRKLKLEYSTPLATSLGLSSEQKKVFRLLVELDYAKSSMRQQELEERLKLARKNMMLKTVTLSSGDFDPLVFSKVFCSLGIVGPKATKQQIEEAIQEPPEKVEPALTALVDQEWLIKEGEFYCLNKDVQVRFSEGDYKKFHLQLIEQSMMMVLKNLESYFGRREETLIESTVISVSKQHYMQKIPEIRTFFQNIQSDLETEDGDELIHFNLQIVPQK